MKRFFSALFVISAYFTFAKNAFAISLCPTDAQFSSLCGLTAGKLGSTVGNFIAFIYLIAVIAALLYLIWGGLKWITSAGDKTALQGAREHIVAAIIGLIIIFLSYLILNFILAFFLPGLELSNLTIPSINGTSVSENDRPGSPE